eukprot:TRINITY_DN4621_c0_g1_i1.p1 TRINITY_DN4621_c0_g1~~TRINITY_DN4621_c0_g1_i1.p1  ORF type:complete len:395 (+),score=169.46 TRINITY_DN4621_c0_g1_i1:160-1344(+)
MADLKRVYNICKFLQNEIQNPSSEDIEVDSLEVAVQCIQTAYGIDLNDEQFKNMDIDSNNNNEEKKEVRSEEEIQFENRFVEYNLILKKQGAYKGLEEGTQEWEEREQLLRSKLKDIEKQKREKTAEQKKAEGNVKLQNHQFNEAIDLYSQAIELNPNNAIYYSNRAAAYSHLKQYKKALEDCKKSIKIDPQYSKAWSRLGLAYYNLNDFEQSVVAYKKAVDLVPDSKLFKEGLKIAENKLKETEEEEAKSNNANANNPAPGGFDFSSLLSNPAVQNLVNNLKGNQQPQQPNQGDQPQQQPQQPDFSSFANMFGGNGGGPNLSNILNDPNIMNVAQNMMQNPAFSDILQNPAVMNMAENMMQNPGALNNLVNNIGGGAANNNQQNDQQNNQSQE